MSGPVTRLSHVALQSPDVGRLRSYYTDVIGLSPYDESDGVVYLASGAQGPALELRSGDEARLDHVGLALAAEREEEMLGRLTEHGVAVTTSADAEPGIARIHEVLDAEGNRLQLSVIDQSRSSATASATGVVPNKIGHVATRTESAAAVSDFYLTALGFRWSDWMGDFFSFLRCNTDHHAVNLINAPRAGQMHHLAFEVTDTSRLIAAADTLAANDVQLIWGPGRHSVGHNMFIYHRDPDGNVVEFFCDLDRMASEDLGYFEPRSWHEDNPQKPKRWSPEEATPNQWGLLPPPDFAD